MASERMTQTETTHQTATNPDSEDPWEDLEATVPNNRNHVSIVTLVECTLVELTHEDVGAVFVEQGVGRMKSTQYVAVDDVGEQFQKRHFDERLGWHETVVSRQTVRDELITQLTRSPPSPTEHSREAVASEPITFIVKPVRELQSL
ncbi:hypothetical protein [Natranaeroarchaeum aerophilus]|uniref:DUF8030 domain-containing protein n=1 Tax=Natranaeroarchaeum aerophilus TaxID=2917711 RepID=A0AAE3FU83_9EURY|nr:hypothetical protein [Natranaeroarchaeum aerophilus]MCL9815256.1 hypothetical protein [Natranaeroarchaeum aerophilus]